MRGSIQNLCQIGSGVNLPYTGYKQTNREAKYIDKMFLKLYNFTSKAKFWSKPNPIYYLNNGWDTFYNYIRINLNKVTFNNHILTLKMSNLNY